MTTTIDYKSIKIERLKDQEYARGYLQAALDEYFIDNNKAAFLQALRDIASAQKGMSVLSNEAGKSRQSLYKSLSNKGNPTLDTLVKVLGNLGYKLSVEVN